MDMDTLLSVDCGRARVALNWSLIRDPVAGFGIFAARIFGQDMVVG